MWLKRSEKCARGENGPNQLTGLVQIRHKTRWGGGANRPYPLRKDSISFFPSVLIGWGELKGGDRAHPHPFSIRA